VVVVIIVIADII